MLTAARTTDDVVEGLALGADDYLAKPFRFEELVARVHALARRAGPARPAVLGRGDLRARPGPAPGHSRRARDRPRAQGVRRPPHAAGRRRGRRHRGGPARVGLGRQRRPVHEHRPHDGDEAAPQARRARGDRDRPGRRLPDVSTVRLRLTLFYAGLLAAASGLLLGASYLLVRDTSTGRSTGRWPSRRPRASPRSTGSPWSPSCLLAAGGGWLVSGKVLGPLDRAVDPSAGSWPTLPTSCEPR